MGKKNAQTPDVSLIRTYDKYGVNNVGFIVSGDDYLVALVDRSTHHVEGHIAQVTGDVVHCALKRKVPQRLGTQRIVRWVQYRCNELLWKKATEKS